MNTNNRCPTKMSDGRLFTDYRTRYAVDNELLNKITDNNIIKSSYETRMYLQKNAENIMKQNYDATVNNIMSCAPCTADLKSPGTMLPEKYKTVCNEVSCNKMEVYPDGLGDGRSF